jgi:hypothetical protein
MGRLEILEKITLVSKRFPKKEESVVFLISKIRKVLEKDNHPEKYIILNFYCNLSLHSKIDRPPKKISIKVKDLIIGKEIEDIPIKFSDFHSQLETFFDEYEVNNFYKIRNSDKSKKIFEQLLIETWSDIPIQIGDGSEYIIKINKDGSASFKHHTFKTFVKMIKKI